MSSRLAQFALLSLALTFVSADSAEAFRRLKWGPFELVPSFAVELRSHDNIYLSNDGVEPTSGTIIDVRPGLNLTVKPNLQKKVRGLYFDARFQPTMALFPSAPPICFGTNTEQCRPGQDPGADKFKIDQNLALGIRYQSSSRLSLSGGIDYSHPELSKANLSLNDFRSHVGAKYDFTKTMSIQANVRASLFETPTRRLEDDGSVATKSTPWGTFDDLTTDAAFTWRALKTLTLGVQYSRSRRMFDGIAAPIADPANPTKVPDDLGNFNKDDVDEDIKGYVQQQITASVSKRLTRQINGSFDFGYIWRNNDERQFGPSKYSDYFVRTAWDTLLGKRTKLQATVDYQITDTVRRLDFTEVNAFTNDQLGQFSVLPEQFAIAMSRRAVLDLTRSVFRRGDQIIVGVAWQKNELRDQYGVGNFFKANGIELRDLEVAEVCEQLGPDATKPSFNAKFCNTVLSDQDQTQVLFTGGYRLRLKSWLGLEARAAFYDGETVQIVKDPERPQPPPVTTSYWNASAGFVINIQALN